jgi:hypothetical protein
MGKYKGLLDDIREKQTGGAFAAEDIPPSPTPAAAGVERMKPATAKRKPGRPKSGKSSNPDFGQVTAYIENSVHLAVQKALLDLKPMDFSDLVNDLLKKWVKSRT